MSAGTDRRIGLPGFAWDVLHMSIMLLMACVVDMQSYEVGRIFSG